MHPKVEQLRGGLVVSCQAAPDDVVYGANMMALMAKAAEAGGAVGIRANSAAHIAAIRQAVELPILGIDKQDLPGYGIRITPDLEAARTLVNAGADIIAVDATKRGALEGRLPATELIRQIRETLDVPVMADISTLDEGIAAAEAGADIVATTLSGYTDYSPNLKTPDFELVRQLVNTVQVPVIAEGRLSTPAEARHVLELGGFAVVVGSMITKPRWITEQYVRALQAYRAALQGQIIGVDIGGTKIATGIIAYPAEVVYVDEIPTLANEGGASVAARVGESIARALEAQPDIRAIGVSTTGEVNAAGEIAYSTGFMPGWMGIPLRARLEDRFGLPTVVENDGQAVAMAEAVYGAGQGFGSVLAITVGTGVGGGLVVDGRIHSGARGAGVEIGHITVERDGRLCTCGRRGCLECYVSGGALLEAYNARAGATLRAEAGKDIMLLAQNGDEDARAAIQEMGEWLGYGLGIALNLFDPAVVVVGGGVAQIGDLFLDSVRKSVRRHAYESVRETPILAATLGARAGMVGAATLARQRLMAG